MSNLYPTVQMQAGRANETLSLPFPSTTPYTCTNGIATVNSEDVPIAMRLGWVPAAYSVVQPPWPPHQLARRMKPTGAGSAQSLVFPDGSTPTFQTINGVVAYAIVPRIWWSFAESHGWIDATYG